MKKSKPRARRRRAPAPGSLRVQAWLHAGIWPLRQTLTRELLLLEQGHLTWSAEGQRLDGFRPARSQLGPAGAANLEDLIAVHAPELAPLCEAQEQSIAQVITAAGVAQVQLVEREIKDALARSGQRKPVDPRLLPGLAAAVINRSIGHDISIDRSTLDAVRPHLEAIPRVGALAAVDQAHARLVAATQALSAALDETSATLCDAYDLPPAPLAEPALHHHR